jgi:hypothetical protein
MKRAPRPQRSIERVFTGQLHAAHFEVELRELV